MTSNSSFMSQVLPSTQRDMNVSLDSHHSEAAGATQPKQQKSRRFSFFRRSTKKEKKAEKFREDNQGRAGFEQNAQSEWITQQYPRPNRIDLERRTSTLSSPEDLQQPQSPGYTNIPDYNYQRQPYNGNSTGFPAVSPPPSMDPRSPRVIPPSEQYNYNQQIVQQYNLNQQDVSPPPRKRALFFLPCSAHHFSSYQF